MKIQSTSLPPKPLKTPVKVDEANTDSLSAEEKSSLDDQLAKQVCTYKYTPTHIPYSGKFLQDEIFTDGSKNENSQIKFLQMLAYHTK